MEFMELMTEWLLLRERERDPACIYLIRDEERKLEIEQELNKRMRGEL